MTRSIITEAGEVQTNRPLRVPRQRVRFGKVGYIGQVEEYDPKFPAIRLAQVEDEEPAPEIPVIAETQPKAKARPKARKES